MIFDETFARFQYISVAMRKSKCVLENGIPSKKMQSAQNEALTQAFHKY